MSKVPPIPKDQQSAHHGGASPPSRDAEIKRDPSRDRSSVNLQQQGQTANLRQNTTNVRRIGA